MGATAGDSLGSGSEWLEATEAKGARETGQESRSDNEGALRTCTVTVVVPPNDLSVGWGCFGLSPASPALF